MAQRGISLELKGQIWVDLAKPFHDTRVRFDTSALPNVFIIDGLASSSPRQAGKYSHEARLENRGDKRRSSTILQRKIRQDPVGAIHLHHHCRTGFAKVVRDPQALSTFLDWKFWDGVASALAPLLGW